jgi:hypothetical protein
MENQKKGLKLRLISNICVQKIFLPNYTDSLFINKTNNSYICDKNFNIRNLPNQTINIRMKHYNVFYTLRNVKNTLKTSSSKRFPINTTKFSIKRSMQKVLRIFLKEIKPILTNKIEIKTHVSIFTKKRLIRNIKLFFRKKINAKSKNLNSKKKNNNIFELFFCRINLFFWMSFKKKKT